MKDTFSQILVHMDATADSTKRLGAACQIANSHRAAVAALYAVTPTLVSVPFTAEGGAPAAAALNEIDDERRDAARAVFDRIANNGAPHATWAEVADYPVSAAFARQALYCDLLVLGQHDAANLASAGVPSDFVEAVMALSGKPALVLPYAHQGSFSASTIVIAWKPTREAARAVRAAIPLLERARRVHILSWGDDKELVVGNRLNLERFLALRGITATSHHHGGPEPESLGDILLSRTYDLEADLLVMGCYGHSLAREWVLGGTSRTILRSMTLPVLMAH